MEPIEEGDQTISVFSLGLVVVVMVEVAGVKKLKERNV